jgi:predicted ribosome quality control (RQC) complex YloA/Tae2 family protein
MIEQIENNIKYKLGRNAKENFELIDEANDINPDYWWFHLEDHSSGHCIVHTELMNKSIALYAGSMVKSNSKVNTTKNVKIIYTQIKNVKKNKTMGEVTLQQKPLVISI